MKPFDVGIIGTGVAGAFAALRLAECHGNLKVAAFDLGRPPGKRRRQLEGWLGCFPTGDGKLYSDDIDKILPIADGRRIKSINSWISKQLEEVHTTKLIKSKPLSSLMQKKIKDAGFEIKMHHYKQWSPDNIHKLSKFIAEHVEAAGNVILNFDNEVHNLSKQNNEFVLSTADGDYRCKHIILCVGRSGWRWVNQLYRKLGILSSDNLAKFGFRMELSGQYLKEFNRAHCSLVKQDLIIGPVSWGGSIIQEDHADLTVAAFRSNEERWKSDKVFFSIIGLKHFENAGCKQTDRLGKLGFLLAGDRVGREKIKLFMRGQSQLNLVPEYAWLKESLEELEKIIPAIINRGYFHYPDISPLTSEVHLNSNLETEIDGLYVAGESAGISGVMAAATMGAIAAEGITK